MDPCKKKRERERLLTLLDGWLSWVDDDEAIPL